MGTKLLLADDSITIQKVVGIIFANEDYELTVVDNGISALEKAREIRPDVLLVDALMPGKSGYEVCAEIRDDARLKGVPLLLLVGAFEPFDEEKARTCGADDFITKPFESQSLIDKVKVLVEVGSARCVAVASEEPEAVSPDLCASVAESDLGTLSGNVELTQEPTGSDANLHASFKGFEHLGTVAVAPTLSEEPVSASSDVSADELAPVPREQENVILLSSVDIVEAAPEDDPWGIFAEEIAEGEPIQFGEVLDDQDEEAGDVAELEPFALMEEEVLGGDFAETAGDVEPLEFIEEPVYAEDELLGTQLADDSEESADFTWAPCGVGESISLGETEPVVTPAQFESLASEEPSGGFTAVDDLLTCAPEVAADDLLATNELMPFASEEELVAVTPVETLHVSSDQQESTVAVQAPQLTEEQLKAALALVSRDVIEKIVWEVVPDLAEMIIKDEIRKIKEGMSR